MAQCELEQHTGNREVVKLKTFIRDNKLITGCVQCIEPMLTCLYPADKRWVVSKGTGKQYRISPAHVRDIKQRRTAPDLSGIWRDKRGIGDAVRY